MNIGEKLKKLRLSLGLNRKQFAHGIINESYLAYVENNKGEIRANDLIAILSKNSFSIINFLADFGNTESYFSLYEYEANNAFFVQDIKRLQQLESSCKSTLIKEVIRLMIAKLNGNLKEFPSQIKAEIKKSFWEMESRSTDSLWVLSNIMEIYDFDDLEGLVNSVFHSFNEFSGYNDETIKLLASITLNYLEICLSQDNIDEHEVERTKSYLSKLPSISLIAFEKIKGKYFLAVHYSDYRVAKKCKKLLG
ncbi:helix-turn-helix domain-containing protein [Lactobacillus kefiranofaciens]|uniref:helix-turn-helix domain-containing protein n=1 Tax=Lactobacillus kefiranofaciens TaxID=267818 RepID=UPI00246862DF|nr:helix-turn-helix transcriptional regulator [Lactobacillus kefiranofaciens]MDH5100060.1 helix-turn-helix domain-containing protein [Lactobacillus kefiranofaciens]